MAVEFQYSPRAQFVQFHQRHQRNALMVCHRRLGKTVACIGDLTVRALHTAKPDARYGYVAPFRQQAKEIAWVYLKNMTEGIRTESPRESELRVKLPNGAWITLYGADNPDALRGLYFDGLILDEFGDMKPSLMGEVILPCLADRNGFLVLIGTAKGRNQFHKYKVMAENSPDWFYKMAKASETGQISPAELQRLKDTMTEAQYEQEMECSFDAALSGTYYADMINRLDQKGQLLHNDTLYEPTQKVHVAADVGLRDSTAWWFWQPRPDGVAVIDHYEASGRYIDHYLGMLHDKGYDYHEIWLPHDAKAKTLATRRSTVEQFAAPGTVRPDIYPLGDRLPIRIVPKMAIQHGIDAVRLFLPSCTFDYRNCAQGLDSLRSYRRQYHEHTQQFSDSPLHNWASNSADAFRYMALVAAKSVAQTADKLRMTRLPNGHVLGQNALQAQGYSLDNLWQDNEKRNNRIIRL
jgi:phage terminase large subunit